MRWSFRSSRPLRAGPKPYGQRDRAAHPHPFILRRVASGSRCESKAQPTSRAHLMQSVRPAPAPCGRPACAPAPQPELWSRGYGPRHPHVRARPGRERSSVASGALFVTACRRSATPSKTIQRRAARRLSQVGVDYRANTQVKDGGGIRMPTRGVRQWTEDAPVRAARSRRLPGRGPRAIHVAPDGCRGECRARHVRRRCWRTGRRRQRSRPASTSRRTP
jgi:hypothetical protein